MSIEEYYQDKIDKYELMSELCIEMLEFDKDDESKKDKIRRLKNEAIGYSNYNRIKAISREIKKAKESLIDSVEIRMKVLKMANIEGHPREYKEYQNYINRLKEIGPKKYLIESLNEIIKNVKNIEELDRQNKKEENIVKDNTSNNIKLNDIIKKHIKLNNPYLEENEIKQIKSQFKIENIDIEDSYLSDDTISRLFIIRIVTERLNRHEEPSMYSIVQTIESLYELALREVDYKKNSNIGTKNTINYENALNSIQFVLNRNYVEEYDSIYEKVKRYYYKLSKEEREKFNSIIEESKYIGGQNKLPTPEEFRKKINDKLKEKIDNWDKYITMEIDDTIEELYKPTKYMTADEIAEYYKSIKEKNYNPEKLQEVFTKLIESRMEPLDIDMPEDEMKFMQRMRYTAICNEYLKEEPIFMDLRDMVVSNGYAKTRIESEDTKRLLYFRSNKYKHSFKGIKYYKNLNKYQYREVIPEDERERIKGI